MPTPLIFSFTGHQVARKARSALRFHDIPTPTSTNSTDAIFIVLRRLRAPLILLITIFTISVIGLVVIEGEDGNGNPVHLSAFDAFYFMSFTATTIGFGELPHTFTNGQRMWVTGSIYASVVGWAYAVASLFSLVQDHALRAAINVERFRRRVRRLQEPFVIVAGCGAAGSSVSRGLDLMGRRFVVIDIERDQIDRLRSGNLHTEVPGLVGDASSARTLGMAGLGSPLCESVLALTDDDETNLAIVMAAQLLRPDMPVFARCSRRITMTRMRDFEPDAVINPYDRYGSYLVLALKHPATFALVTWLTSPVGTPVPEPLTGLTDGPWVVCSNDAFGDEVAGDLGAAGLEVRIVDPDLDPDPDVTGAVGFIAGTTQDTTNLSLATRARITSPGIFVAVRQELATHDEMISGMGLDSVFVPPELVARETLAHLVAPGYWAFIDHAVTQQDDWAQEVINELTDCCGSKLRPSWPLSIDSEEAPALARFLKAGNSMTLDTLLRRADNRSERLPIVALLLRRGDQGIAMPDLDTELQVGDEIVVTGTEQSHSELLTTVNLDEQLAYIASGERTYRSWIWRRWSELSGRASTH